MAALDLIGSACVARRVNCGPCGDGASRLFQPRQRTNAEYPSARLDGTDTQIDLELAILSAAP